MKYNTVNEVYQAKSNGITDPEIDNILAGVYAYGKEKVDELLQQARQNETTLVFYYATPEDELMDALSYKFEDTKPNP